MARTRINIGPEAQELLTSVHEFLKASDIDAYVVGGFLRDVLLGRDSHDIDICIAADPFLVGRNLADAFGGHFFPLAAEKRGDARKVARVLLPERGLHIDLLPLRAELEADLRERDYTIDAMAAPLAEAVAGAVTIIDPCGGRRDCKRRLVRLIGEEACRRDSLRLMRGVRLCAELDFSLDENTAAIIRGNAWRLPQAARERQREEMMRILATPRAAQGLRLLDELGLLVEVLPELAATKGVEQPKEHHWDVFLHSLETVANLDVMLGEEEPHDRRGATLWRHLWGQLQWLPELRPYFGQEVAPGQPRAAVLKLGGLLHDIAKPETKTFDESGRMRFFRHAEQGAEKARHILRRLRFGTRVIEMVATMVKEHLRPLQLAQQGEPTRRALYRFFRDCGEAAIEVLFLSLADHLATVGPRVNIAGWRDHVSLVSYFLAKRYEEATVVAPPRLVTGHDLMQELGLAPGPLIGRLLEAVREAQAAGEVCTREEALALARREAKHPPLILSVSKDERLGRGAPHGSTGSP